METASYEEQWTKLPAKEKRNVVAYILITIALVVLNIFYVGSIILDIRNNTATGADAETLWVNLPVGLFLLVANIQAVHKRFQPGWIPPLTRRVGHDHLNLREQ